VRDPFSDDSSDHDDYFLFTGRARLSRDMHILEGYLQGLVADQRVRDVELRQLADWLGNHNEFADRHPFNEVIPRVQKIVANGIVDEEERADLLWLSNRFSTDNEYYDEVTSDMQRLQGILAGILADGIITEAELDSLQQWVNERKYLQRCWPYDELESIIEFVMRDGRIDAQEHEALMQFFDEFVAHDERKAVGAIERDFTVSGVCTVSPEITFESRGFCFTGASKRGPRTYLASVVTERGGTFHKNLRKNTDFLIVGADGNPCWAFACYGRKVEEAVERRRDGQRIAIVHESDFWDAADIG